MRKVIAIILLLAAVGGLVYGIIGATQKTVKVKSGGSELVYNFDDHSYEGSVSWSSAGGLAINASDLPRLAQAQRSRQMWMGIGAFAVLGIAGVCLLRKKQY